MRLIDRIIIHCSATPSGRYVTIEQIRGWHLAKGWSDIGYHYVIHLDGSVHVGRPIERAGAHVRGYNENSIGICYVGGVDADDITKAMDTRTEAQVIALRALVEGLHGVWPAATIHGHNEFANKACPSFNVATDL